MSKKVQQVKLKYDLEVENSYGFIVMKLPNGLITVSRSTYREEIAPDKHNMSIDTKAVKYSNILDVDINFEICPAWNQKYDVSALSASKVFMSKYATIDFSSDF